MKKIVLAVLVTTNLTTTIWAMEEKVQTASAAGKPSVAIPTFKSIQEQYQDYQKKSVPELKMKIISNLNTLLIQYKLEDKDKDDAKNIAEALKAPNLAIRIKNYSPDKDYVLGDLALPKELIHQIIAEVIGGKNIEDIMNLLHVNKGMHSALLNAHVEIDLSKYGSIVTDKTLEALVELFPNMVTLNLAGCGKISNVGFQVLQHLPKISRVDLTSTKITDSGLAHLKNATSLNLTDCRQITNAGLAHLTKATEVNLTLCYNITDAGLAHLTNATSINLRYCNQITDAGLAHLTKATSLSLAHCTQITDAGLAHLTNATEVDLGGCKQITDAGLVHLKKVTEVDLSLCIRITDAGLAHLIKATKVTLTGCKQITAAGLAHLTNATSLNLTGCTQITAAAKAALRARGVKVFG